MKMCQKCWVEQDFNEFYKSEKSKDGFTSNCKSCINEMKACTKCGTIKEFSEFRKNKRSIDGLAYYCKHCSNEIANEKQKKTVKNTCVKCFKSFNKTSSINGTKICKICIKKQSNEEKIKNKIKVNGFVYGIVNPAWDGWVKVGRATEPSNRLNTYQTCSPFRDYEFKFYIKVKDLHLVEDFVYNNYECKHEWVFEDFNKLHKNILDFITKHDL